METQKVNIKDAVKILGMTDREIRYKMQNGDLPIGYVTKSRGTRKRYDIYKAMLMNYLHLETWPEM